MSYPLGSADSNRGAEYYAEPEEAEARPRFRGVFLGLIALLAMGLFAGGLWLAYLQGLRHAGSAVGGGEVPLIRADQRPTKVKPENPGGMEVPDRDKLIYTQKRAAVEHLLPPPEKPMPRPTASPVDAAKSDAQPPASPAPPSAAAPAFPLANAPQQMAVKPSEKTESAPSTQSARPKAGGMRIQLGSVRSEEAARQEWDHLKRLNPDLLATLSATPVRADLGEKGVFYRIRSGPIADADRVCRELNRRNIGCIVVR